MAMTTGRCTNSDYCTKADRREIITLRDDEPFLCPECGHRLVSGEHSLQSSTNFLPLVLGGGFVVLALAGGIAAWKFFGSPAAPSPVSAPISTNASTTSTAGSAVANVAAVPADLSVLLRLRGDTALCKSLGVTLAAGFLSFSGDTNISAQPQTNGDIAVNGLRGGKRETIEITPTNNEDGFSGLLNGSADVAFSARAITRPERTANPRLNDLCTPSTQHLAALDALAVITNPASEISSISVDQLRAVIDGSIKDWSDLGASSADLHLLGQIPGNHEILPAANPSQIVAQVQKDPLSMAIVSLHDAGTAKILGIRSTGDAVSPSKTSILNGDYALVHKDYFYTAPNSLNILVQRFAEFTNSTAGQDAVTQAGYTGAVVAPLPVQASGPQTPATAQTVLSGLTKINYEIHFDPNSTTPDVHAMRFIDSLYNLLISEHATPNKMVIVGFADSQGNDAANLEVSKHRADAIAAILIARGMTPGKVEAFGSQNPIADNSTEEGREANRRVEIYLSP